MRLHKVFREVWHTLLSLVLDVIAPKEPDIRAIEKLGYEGFHQKALKSLPHRTFKDLMCVYHYKDPLVKKAILDVKSYGNRTIGDMLGKALYEALILKLDEKVFSHNFERPLLVPIPMTQKNIRERGWNQCIILAKALRAHDAENRFELAPEALIKIRVTEDQVGKGRRERFKNLEGCFEAGRHVKGRNVIVLDDICTTGATLLEAKKALEEGGARNVVCIALAC
jgi:ComF family protein